MTLPDDLPADIDYEFYTKRAFDMLESFQPKAPKQKAAA
jgi:hypothetical protein